MDNFISDLTRYTQQLEERRHAFGGVTLWHSSDRDDEDVLRCDGFLRARWSDFAAALRSFDRRSERTHSSSESDSPTKKEGWWLSNVELSEDIRDILEPILTDRKSLRTLVLDRNELGRDGVAFLCNIVERNSNLKRISFHNNPMGNIRHANRFCEAVSEHPSLEHLTLENVGLGDDEDKLSMILNASKNLKCLGLAGNGIGSRSAAALLVELLSTNTIMKIVYLRDNDFGDESAHLFASLLQRNNGRLRVVDLGDNRFSRFGRRIIRNALFDASSLNAAMESNHDCVVYLDEIELKDKLGVINCKGTPEQSRRRKVRCALHATIDGGRLGELLNDVPLGLMPKVLSYLQGLCPGDIPRGMTRHAMESLQQYTLDDFDEAFARQTTITIVFEALRGWNLPSLFTNI